MLSHCLYPPTLRRHENIQAYLEQCYASLIPPTQSFLTPANGNEIYGEMSYYSLLKLFRSLPLKAHDHFLDIGSGLGKVVFQVFLNTAVASSTGIEIHALRHQISAAVATKVRADLPSAFQAHRRLDFIQADFLSLPPTALQAFSVVYLCSTVFSRSLLQDMAEKIHWMPQVHTVLSFRKLPSLKHFILSDKIFCQGSWDNTACYLYRKPPQDITT